MAKSHLCITLAAALFLTSCSSNKEPVESRQGKDSRDQDSLFSLKKEYSRPGLEVPPDLLASANEKVRANNSAATASTTATGAATGTGSQRVLPEVIGATIQSDTDRTWLEIDADAEVVWRKLTEFWAFQEIELVEYLPESGLMETAWFVKKSDNTSGKSIGAIAVDLFEAFTARRTALDKFTLRLQRRESGGTNLFITHRGREKIAKEQNSKQKPVEYEWVEREQSSEKIAQLLQTIVLLFESENGESA